MSRVDMLPAAFECSDSLVRAVHDHAIGEQRNLHVDPAHRAHDLASDDRWPLDLRRSVPLVPDSR